MDEEQRCNYECVNTMGSYKCIDGIGADQPFSNDFDDYMVQNNDDDDINYFKKGKFEDSIDDTDGNYDIIDGASSVSECLNGFYFNETVGDCQGMKRIMSTCEFDVIMYIQTMKKKNNKTVVIIGS